MIGKDDTIVPFIGTIYTVSQDGMCAIVALEEAHRGGKYLLITSETVGYIRLLNGRGRPIVGTVIEGVARARGEILHAVAVSSP